MKRPVTADVYGIGNALVDFEHAVEESFFASEGIAKGHMTLVDEGRIAELGERLSDDEAKRASGGSAANTVFAVQGFGGQGPTPAASPRTRPAIISSPSSPKPASTWRQCELPPARPAAASRSSPPMRNAR